MELRQIRYFAAAAEELNISRAARRLNISQPAVSRMIRDLEAELGTPLFVRERFGLSLTVAGEQMLKYARQILELCQETLTVIGKLADSAAVLNVGFLSSSLGSFLGEALHRFRDQEPDVLIKIHELSPADQILALRKNQIDLALLGNPCGAVSDEFELRSLFTLELQAVLPGQHPLADRQLVALKELADDDFIGYHEKSFPGRNLTITNACKLAGFKPKLRYQVSSLVEALAMIASGVGVCLMPEDVASLPHPKVTFVSVEEPLEPIQFAAAWRREDERTSLRHFLECLTRSPVPPPS